MAGTGVFSAREYLRERRVTKWFPDAQGREWPKLQKEVEAFRDGDLKKKFGGVFRERTPVAHFVRACKAYLALVVAWQVSLLCKDHAVKGQVAAAMAHHSGDEDEGTRWEDGLQTEGGEGFDYWLKAKQCCCV